MQAASNSDATSFRALQSARSLLGTTCWIWNGCRGSSFTAFVQQQMALLGLLLPAMAFPFSANNANPALTETWLIIAGTSSRAPFRCARNGTTKVHTKEEMTNQSEAN
jgi:hypothetical protein